MTSGHKPLMPSLQETQIKPLFLKLMPLPLMQHIQQLRMPLLPFKHNLIHLLPIEKRDKEVPLKPTLPLSLLPTPPPRELNSRPRKRPLLLFKPLMTVLWLLIRRVIYRNPCNQLKENKRSTEESLKLIRNLKREPKQKWREQKPETGQLKNSELPNQREITSIPWWQTTNRSSISSMLSWIFFQKMKQDR